MLVIAKYGSSQTTETAGAGLYRPELRGQALTGLPSLRPLHTWKGTKEKSFLPVRCVNLQPPARARPGPGRCRGLFWQTALAGGVCPPVHLVTLSQTAHRGGHRGTSKGFLIPSYESRATWPELTYFHTETHFLWQCSSGFCTSLWQYV